MVRFFILIIFFPALCSAQLSETFSDGDFSSSPLWVGTAEKFTVDEDFKLQLSAPAVESEAWLFTESNSIEEAYWSVRVIMDFNPSSNNLTRIYLCADATTPAEMKNALFVEIGNTTDDICLYSLTGSNTTKLIDGVDDRTDLTSVDVRVEVTRVGNIWTLKSDAGSGLQTEGTANYLPGYSSSYFGLYCKYTSTRSRKFWFDDIEVTGEPYCDTDPPLLMESQLVNGENIHLIFSEPVDTTSLSDTDFMLEKSQRNPSSVTVTNGSSSYNITLHFNPALSDVEDETLLISGVSDLYGNRMTDTSVIFNYKRVFIAGVKIRSDSRVDLTFSKDIDENSIVEAAAKITPGEFAPQISLTHTNVVTLSLSNSLTEDVEYQLTLSKFKDISGDTILTVNKPFLYHLPARYNIVFSEIMTDPTPSVGSPDSEFIEIFNRTLYPMNIAEWKLMINNKSTRLPEFVLMPGKEVALFPASEDESWDTIPNRLPLQGWTSLTNSSGELVLTSETGRVIDALRYSIDVWGDDSFKQGGGWSFERIDVDNLSGSANSWRYSVIPTGSTPGRTNSVKASLPDETAPEIELITYENPDRIKLWFTESINLFVNNLITYFKVEKSSVTISQIVPDTVFADNCIVVFSDELKRNSVHEFSRVSLTDNAGNVLAQTSNRFFGRPDTISSQEKNVVINEILFNPKPDGYDFVELFNRSQKIVNLSSLSFADSKESDEITKLFPLTPENILLFPGQYHVFSISPKNIEAEYGCKERSHLHKMNSFPSMPNDNGIVTLSLRSGEIIDRLHYDESMHFPLLNSAEGVSLERISPESETDTPDNWHSASADCGYGTPTARNSQYSNLQRSNRTGFTLENEIFTPNADGDTDQLILNYSFENTGTVVNIGIYNAKGLSVKALANNKLLGTEGFLTWDGTSDDGVLVRPGIYIILVKTYTSTGKTATSKITCVVGIGSLSR